MSKKLCFGIIIGVFFVYLSLRGVDLEGVSAGLKTARFPFVIPVLILFVCIQILRSYRWGIILKPIITVDPFSLFAITSVGFLAVVAIPARIGELARPYLISTKTGVSISSAMGTVLVERVFDGLGVLALVLIVILFTPLPPWLIRGSILFFLITLILLGCMTFLIFRRETALNLLSPLLKKFPERWHLRLSDMIDHLIDGFKIIPHWRSMCYLALLSMTIWVINAVSIFVLFFAFGFDLPLSAAFVLMAIIILGIAIPTAPGFVGNWHFFCVLGLGLFGIHKTDALTYAIVLHFLSIGTVGSLGLIFLPFNRFSPSDIRRSLSTNHDG